MLEDGAEDWVVDGLCLGYERCGGTNESWDFPLTKSKTCFSVFSIHTYSII